ncbi:MAG: hypothetical protein ABSD61_03120 [Terracidiphilus sp.]|jgi:hypothetical protein
MQTNPRDNTLTLIALGVLAFILADTTHEALGHGLATLAVGGTPVLLTSSYLSTSGHYSRWIPAGGGIANVILGLLALGCTRLARKAAPSLLYFFILLAAFNLLFAAAYPFYSGVALFGDWAGVIAGLAPAWPWRALLIVGSVSLYWLFLFRLAVAIRPFRGESNHASLDRLHRITLIPFLSALVIASIAGAFNPEGWINILIAAAPAAASSFGVTQLDHFRATLTSDPASPLAPPIPRSPAWIAAAALAAILFVAFLGPGIHFH